MKTNYVLIDYENVQVKSLALLSENHFRVRVFLGKTNTKVHSDLAIAMQAMGERAQYVQLESSGANALDFHIAYYVGRLLATDPTGFVHIISKDTGFDPLVHYLKTQKLMTARSASIEQMPCFVQPPPAVVPAPPQSTPAKSSPLTKAKPPAKKPAVELDERVRITIVGLITPKAKRPAKMQTLLNSIHNRIGMDRPVAEAKAVRDVLVAKGYVLEDGLKVTYKLPKSV